jgi:hypothetical protein
MFDSFIFIFLNWFIIYIIIQQNQFQALPYYLHFTLRDNYFCEFMFGVIILVLFLFMNWNIISLDGMNYLILGNYFVDFLNLQRRGFFWDRFYFFRRSLTVLISFNELWDCLAFINCFWACFIKLLYNFLDL